jgi:hypothetical protein
MGLPIIVQYSVFTLPQEVAVCKWVLNRGLGLGFSRLSQLVSQVPLRLVSLLPPSPPPSLPLSLSLSPLLPRSLSRSLVFVFYVEKNKAQGPQYWGGHPIDARVWRIQRSCGAVTGGCGFVSVIAYTGEQNVPTARRGSRQVSCYWRQAYPAATGANSRDRSHGI